MSKTSFSVRKKKSKKYPLIGLALGGGSARGIAHIGVLKAFIENSIPIDFISGTSAGAIVAASFAFGVPPNQMIEKSKNLSWYTLSSLPNSKLGLVSNKNLEKLIQEIIGSVDIEDARTPLAIMATNIETGKKVVLRRGHLVDAIRASSCLPGIFIPVEINGAKLIDGGFIENLPISPLQEMGANIIIGVNVVRWPSKNKMINLLDVVSISTDILIRNQNNPSLEKANVLIEPNLENFSPSDFKKTDELVAEGYRAAINKMPEIKRLIGKRIAKNKPTGFFKQFIKFFNE
ncbi:MAG: patatin-like phospholipase family protein [Candidatus Paceibacterota bacterium]|jgi:NTE family protein